MSINSLIPSPWPPSAVPDDTPHSYASRLALWALCHIPDHGSIATAGLTDDQLESTCWGLNQALTQRLILDELSTPPIVYDRIAAVLVFCRQRQTARRRDQEQLITQATEQPSHPPASHPNGGKPVFPPPPAPKPIQPEGRLVRDGKVEVVF